MAIQKIINGRGEDSAARNPNRSTSPRDLLPTLGLLAVTAAFAVGAKTGIFGGDRAKSSRPDAVQPDTRGADMHQYSEQEIRAMPDHKDVIAKPGEGALGIAYEADPESFSGWEANRQEMLALQKIVYEQTPDGRTVQEGATYSVPVIPSRNDGLPNIDVGSMPG